MQGVHVHFVEDLFHYTTGIAGGMLNGIFSSRLQAVLLAHPAQHDVYILTLIGNVVLSDQHISATDIDIVFQ